MRITFVGGPWHGTSRTYEDPVPERIAAGPDAHYVAWDCHAATPGVVAGPLEHTHPYVLETLMPPHLLERVQDLLLHPTVPGAAASAGATAMPSDAANAMPRPAAGARGAAA
ncbi:hypothetical protein [Luteimonas kalidii]|uniref:Uncharacterized protein n=1 Tax=Luteimonas kalidii TaxID=3042025 RepID=A0ABT6JYI4_9GAMM|nr:hypothetical protein [Luteimonas kalidii]MDH5835652.1 hypothetical protein [Luteimonas kalidii]